MRRFPKFRDPRFALTTLQNPNIEVRTYAQLVQAAQQEREWQARAAQYAAPQPLAAPAAPDSIPSVEFPENVASTAPVPLSTRHFLIGHAAINNARNSPENNALHFSNRLKTANCSARFSQVLRSNNHDSRIASFLFDTNKAHKIIILMRVLLKTKEKRVAFHIVDGVTNQVYSRFDRENCCRLVLKNYRRPADPLCLKSDGHLDAVRDLDERNATVHSVVFAVKGHGSFNLAHAFAFAVGR